MSNPEPNIAVPVDVTNPGQFLACCGLLEVAQRLWRGAEGSFEGTSGCFGIWTTLGSASLKALLTAFKTCALTDPGGESNDKGAESDDDDRDEKATPLSLGQPIELLLDWYAGDSNKDLKPWAGSMDGRLIFLAMKNAIDETCPDPFAQSTVVSDPRAQMPNESSGKRRRTARPKKREPFYFDARRGASATARDIGFMPDALRMTTEAFPAVEALSLVGLQRFRPTSSNTARVFEYCTWSMPLPPALAAVAACGRLPGVGAVRYRFENAFRTDQRKHKGFMPATRIGEES